MSEFKIKLPKEFDCLFEKTFGRRVHTLDVMQFMASGIAVEIRDEKSKEVARQFAMAILPLQGSGLIVEKVTPSAPSSTPQRSTIGRVMSALHLKS